MNLGPELADEVTNWFNEGLSSDVIAARLQERGFSASRTGVGRHKSRHLAVVVDGAEPDDSGEGPRTTDLEVVEDIIRRGASNIRRGKATVSTEQLLRALDLKYKLTSGSAFQDFFDQVAAAMTEADGEG